VTVSIGESCSAARPQSRSGLEGGIAGSVLALGFWGERSFGQLNPSQTLRTVIPAVTCLTLGCQIIFSSFFLSVLGLGRR